jgi:hypothetical protein
VTDDDAVLARIERERRRRERDLFLALLLYANAPLAVALRHATIMMLHGGDPGYAIRSVVTGTNGFRGAAPLIARAMGQAHRDGYRRAGLMAGTRAVERADAGTLATLVDLYMPGAREAAAAMAATLVQAVYEAVARARSLREQRARHYAARCATRSTPRGTRRRTTTGRTWRRSVRW